MENQFTYILKAVEEVSVSADEFEEKYPGKLKWMKNLIMKSQKAMRNEHLLRPRQEKEKTDQILSKLLHILESDPDSIVENKDVFT